MRQKNSWFNASTALAVIGMALVLTHSTQAASSSKVLHRFTGGPDGANPFAGLIFDAAGNLYGTTSIGGLHHQGTVFRLMPNPDGTWTESVLHSFGAGTDGSNPSAPLIFDAEGNLYGTTEYGGGSSACNGGCGTVFKLQPSPNGSWTESVLYRFAGLPDGAASLGGLVFDTAGNLYGTTQTEGLGLECCGTVFKLEPNSNGSWTGSVLYRFTGGADGAFPTASLIFDAAGNLYGTTSLGGSSHQCGVIGCGTVFKLEPNSNGSWTESVLYSLTGGTGSLIFDTAGNLYGMTGVGGCPTCGTGGSGCGTVFRLKPNLDGSWTESIIHSFDNRSGGFPNHAGLIADASGSLYGTTSGGGSTNCPGGGCGTAFRLKPNADGSWAYSVLHYFFGEPAKTPLGNLVLHNTGLSLYGTTVYCGTNVSCKGVVFEITP